MSSVSRLRVKKTLDIASKSYEFFQLDVLEHVERLPFSLKILLENLLRNEDGAKVTGENIDAVVSWDPQGKKQPEIQFTPTRVIMQDFTGVPCVVDLAAMREAVFRLGGNPADINPKIPVDLVIDHSVVADVFGRSDALERNIDLEYMRNGERYQFLRWGQTTFDRFRVVPPGTGIVHQVNVEYLASVVGIKESEGVLQVFPDTCVGTDSHTTMMNGLGVLGWGVGGIEAEAAMLGQPISMLVPGVVGFKLTGHIPKHVTATDVVLTITQLLRSHGVVGKIVEFYGDAVAEVPVANRVTIGNMSPEFGSTAAIFPVDDATCEYLALTGRSGEHVALVEAYTKAQGLWHNPLYTPTYSEYLELDLSSVVPSIAGPKRPQDRIELSSAKQQFDRDICTYSSEPSRPVDVTSGDGKSYTIDHGSVVLAAITSCTNTSNPSVMLAAGLLARNARKLGLSVKPWVKTTLAPGSQVVTEYFKASGLNEDLEALGFYTVGYGCTTCIGNSGPLPEDITQAVEQNELAVVAVLSGNRNFEGRINPDVKMSYLASPPLVVAYALAGRMNFDFDKEPLGLDHDGNEVFLADIWPDARDIEQISSSVITQEMYVKKYSSVFEGDERWGKLSTPISELFEWKTESTYVQNPPYFETFSGQIAPVANIREARVLVKLGDSVTTDHISPAGAIKQHSPAGVYLVQKGVLPHEFNSYGSRRGNHEVMIRGTFANIRLKNHLVGGLEGGYTRDFTQTGAPQTTIFEASENYRKGETPLIILAGQEYGSGSSRDWAAKGTSLLGVRAVIAESFERIHRSNLIGMGVLPLEFVPDENMHTLGLDGTEYYSITGIEAFNEGRIPYRVCVSVRSSAETGLRPSDHISFDAVVRVDTPTEAEYYRHGGILSYVLRSLI